MNMKYLIQQTLKVVVFIAITSVIAWCGFEVINYLTAGPSVEDFMDYKY